MPRTIQCNHCGVVLNLPDQAVGKRLKCPRCGEKFSVGSSGSAGSQVPIAPNQDPASSVLLTKQSSTNDLPAMPTAAGNLRETFDLPLMTEAAGSSGKSKSASGHSGMGQSADALALFDEPPAPRKRKTGAEGRSQARRCPTCNAIVPIGMSLCQSCGLDLESGTRIDLTDDLAPPAPAGPPGPPIPIVVLGGLCAAGSLAMAVVSLIKWKDGFPGAIYFFPVALFGVYAAVQFILGKTAKPLLAALTLAAVLDLTFLVAVPIYNANAETVTEQRNVGDDPDAETEKIKPLAEQLDTAMMTRGLTLLFLYAVVSIYLLSPHVKNHMRK